MPDRRPEQTLSLYNEQTKAVERVPESKVTELMASGMYRMPKMRVRVVTPDGRRGFIPAENAAAAFRQGYSYETNAEGKAQDLKEIYEDAPGTAFTLGAADTFTGGASKVAMSKFLGPDAKEVYEGIEKHNPWAYGSGGAAGFLGGLVTGAGAPGAIAKVGAKAAAAATTKQVAKSALGRVAAKAAPTAAAGAVEAGLFGAIDNLKESALGNSEFTAESLLAHVGLSAVMGGAVGGVLGGLLPAGKEFMNTGAIKKVRGAVRSGVEKAGKYPKELLHRLEDTGYIKAIGGKTKEIKYLIGSESEGGFGIGYVAGVLKGKNALGKEIVQMRGRKANASELKEAIDDIGENILGSFRKSVSNTEGATINMRQLAIDAVESVAKETKGSKGPLRRFTKAIDKILEDADDNLSLDEANKYMQAIRQTFFPSKGAYAEFGADYYREAASRFVKSVARKEAEVVESLAKSGAVTKKAAAKFLEARKNYAALKVVQKAASDMEAQSAVSSVMNLPGLAMGTIGGVTAGPVGVAVGLAAKALHKEFGDVAGAKLAGVALKADKYLTMEAGRRVIAKRINSAVDALKSAPLPSSAKHIPYGAITERATRDYRKSILDEEDVMPESASMQEIFEKRIEEVAKLAQNPVELQKKIEDSVKDIAPVAPELAMSMQIKASTAINFLASKVPQGYQSTAEALGVKPKRAFPRHVIDKWFRYYKAVNDPVSILEELTQGRVSAEAIEAGDAVAPGLMAGMRDAVLSSLPEMKKTMKYHDRIRMGQFLKMPDFDDMLHPDKVSYLQGQFSGEAQQAEEGPKLPKYKPSKIDTEGRLETETERIMQS